MTHQKKNSPESFLDWSPTLVKEFMDSSIRPPPSPPKEDPPPRPKIFPRKGQPRTDTGSSEESNPPSYIPRIPPPFMCGYMEKGSGEPAGKSQMWSRKYVEVSEGELRFYNSRDERGEGDGVTVPLVDSFVSLQDKRIVRLESRTGIRLFRTSSDSRALKWVYTISRYSSVAPTAEGYCKKLSGGKNILEDRYLKLTADGIISWYEKEDDTRSKGAIQVRGESVTLDADDRRILYVHTKGRRYHFTFIDEHESNRWLTSLSWHSCRHRLDNSMTVVRNLN